VMRYSEPLLSATSLVVKCQRRSRSALYTLSLSRSTKPHTLGRTYGTSPTRGGCPKIGVPRAVCLHDLEKITDLVVEPPELAPPNSSLRLEKTC